MFEGLELVSFIRISRFKWVGYVKRVDQDSKPKSILKNQPGGNRSRPSNH